MDVAPPVSCPECGGRQLTADDAQPGFLVCLCGVKQPDPSHPGVTHRRDAAAGAPPPPPPVDAELLTDGKLQPPPPPGEPPPEGELAAAPAAASSEPSPQRPQQKKKPVTNAKLRIPKWMPEVGRRLGGAPKFAIKEALRLYGKASKDSKRQGCNEWGLALAALGGVLHRHQLEASARELCDASVGGPNHKGPYVKPEQLDACAKVVARVQRTSLGAAADEPLPSPLAAHFASQLCEELQPARLSKARPRARACMRARALSLRACAALAVATNLSSSRRVGQGCARGRGACEPAGARARRDATRVRRRRLHAHLRAPPAQGEGDGAKGGGGAPPAPLAIGSERAAIRTRLTVATTTGLSPRDHSRSADTVPRARRARRLGLRRRRVSSTTR
eukprot:2998064-Prymnesium_polylepis.1